MKYRLTAPERTSRIDYPSTLNPQQLAVVTAGDGPILVIAGAGSGKTRTLTYRVAHLIDRGIGPASIVLCTFTNKAAKEMLSRVEHLAGGDARLVWGGTFHHLANRLLRQYCPSLGYGQGYSILDQEDARDLLGACLASWEESRSRNSSSRRLLPRPEVLGDLISFTSNTLAPLDQVLLLRSPNLLPLQTEILEIARGYQERKRAMDAMDFDDLLSCLLSLLRENREVSTRISEQFRHVLVDEYQDTNALQSAIVDLLAATHGNLTVVGDDAQAIYGFRGANPANMLSFQERWNEAQLFKLEINYRSSPEILRSANRSIAENRDQLPKVLQATRANGPLPALVTIQDSSVQAAFVAQRVMELRDEGIGLNEMAVIYRAHSHSLELQVELTRRGIAYIVRSGVRFFEQAHIKDVLAHLRVLENPRDELSWTRVLRLQPGIGRTTTQKIWALVSAQDNPLDAVLQSAPLALPQRARAGFERLRALLGGICREEVRTRPAAAIRAVLEGGYRELLPTLYLNSQSREEDLEQLARYADQFDSVQSFLSELNLLSGFSTEEVLQAKRPEELLTLTTAHQAKGLEWRVVFLLGLCEGLFPHPWALTEAAGDDQEERRLFYVAVTRTMEQLYLCSPLVADRSGQRRVLLKPSRFVKEIDVDGILDHWAVEDFRPSPPAG